MRAGDRNSNPVLCYLQWIWTTWPPKKTHTNKSHVYMFASWHCIFFFWRTLLHFSYSSVAPQCRGLSRHRHSPLAVHLAQCDFIHVLDVPQLCNGMQVWLRRGAGGSSGGWVWGGGNNIIASVVLSYALPTSSNLEDAPTSSSWQKTLDAEVVTDSTVRHGVGTQWWGWCCWWCARMASYPDVRALLLGRWLDLRICINVWSCHLDSVGLRV